MRHRFAFAALAFLLAFAPLGCASLQQFANLRNVDFHLDSARNVRLAGVEMDRVRQFSDLRTTDFLRLSSAVVANEMPLTFTLNVGAENPAANDVGARMVAFDWTLFLQDKETVSGTFNDEVYLAPGVTTNVPVQIDLDLVQFFGRNARELVDVALALTGQEGVSSRVRLVARPSIQTPLGALRYPRPITIVNREVGAQQPGAARTGQ